MSNKGIILSQYRLYRGFTYYQFKRLFIGIICLLPFTGLTQDIITIDSSLNSPTGITIDKNKSLYIANSMANQIIQINSSGIKSTIAGSGVPSYFGDGGPATASGLYNPFSTAIDTSGNIYVADFGNNRVRKITALTGIIITIAGDSVKGYNGDGIAATSAELNAPQGVAVDDSGNIYIADAGNNRIRKVMSSTGKIYTIAGNGNPGFNGDGSNALSIELNSPSGIVIWKKHIIYIADENNNRIRKLNTQIDSITTIAGTKNGGYNGDGMAATSAELLYPSSVALDTLGNIYIADNTNNRIRKVTISTGIISTIAGNGIPAFSGDGGLATNAELDSPSGVCVDDSGYVFIADMSNNRIRKVSQKLTGFNEQVENRNVSISPNPSNGNFTFQLQGIHQLACLEIFSLMGQAILCKTFETNEGGYNVSLDGNQDGVYLYRISTNDEVIKTGKIIVESK